MKRGVLPYVMIVLMTVIGMVNFLAPFVTDYKSDPFITYIFMGVASTIAFGKGLSHFLPFRKGDNDVIQRESEQ